jgi:hypothetical protein
MRFAAKSFEAIAGQLGNSAWQVAEVYARFEPMDAEKAEVG